MNLVNIINLELSSNNEDYTVKNDYDFKVQLPFNFRVGTGANFNITDNLILYSDLLVQFSKLKLKKIKITPAFLFDQYGEIVDIDENGRNLIPENTIKIKIYGIAMTVGIRYSLGTRGGNQNSIENTSIDKVSRKDSKRSKKQSNQSF